MVLVQPTTHWVALGSTQSRFLGPLTVKPNYVGSKAKEEARKCRKCRSDPPPTRDPVAARFASLKKSGGSLGKKEALIWAEEKE